MSLAVRQHHDGDVGLLVLCPYEDAFKNCALGAFHGPADRCAVTDRTAASNQSQQSQECVSWVHGSPAINGQGGNDNAGNPRRGSGAPKLGARPAAEPSTDRAGMPGP